MNRSTIIRLAALFLVAFAGINSANAQFGNLGQAPQRPRPTVSPFINQGIGGGISAFNYYGIIKPQFDTTRSIQQLQTGVQMLNVDGSLKGALDQGQPNGVGTMQTGHAATYFNYSHYFPMSYGSTSTGGASSGFGTGVGGANTGNRPFYGSTLNTFAR